VVVLAVIGVRALASPHQLLGAIAITAEAGCTASGADRDTLAAGCCLSNSRERCHCGDGDDGDKEGREETSHGYLMVFGLVVLWIASVE
jgi:hypothetical protein